MATNFNNKLHCDLFIHISLAPDQPVPECKLGKVYQIEVKDQSFPVVTAEMLFFYNFVILAMAGYLTSVFRTPITGIVLIMELTHSFEHWPSVIIVCIVAHIFSQYIYDSSLYEKIIAD